MGVHFLMDLWIYFTVFCWFILLSWWCWLMKQLFGLVKYILFLERWFVTLSYSLFAWTMNQCKYKISVSVFNFRFIKPYFTFICFKSHFEVWVVEPYTAKIDLCLATHICECTLSVKNGTFMGSATCRSICRVWVVN